MSTRSGFKLRYLRWWIIALVMLGTIANYLARSSLGITAPTLMKALDFNTQQYSYIVSAFQFMYAVGAPICGYVLDFLGLKLGFALFACLWSLFTMAHGLAGSWQSIAFFRGGVGLTEATAIPAGMKAVSEWFPARERGLAGAIFNMGTSVGAMLAPPLVVWSILTYSWHFAFVVTGGIGLVWVILWAWLYKSPEHHPALSDAEREYILSGQERNLQPKGPRPSLGTMLRQRNLWGIALPRLLADPAWGTLNYWIPLYLMTERHLALHEMAMFAWLPYLAADLGCLFGGGLSTLLVKHLKMPIITARRTAFTVGAVLMTSASAITLVDNVYAAVALLCILGFSHQCLSTTVITMSSDLFPKNQVGTATGLAALVGSSGNMAFNLVMGTLILSVGYAPFFICLGIFDLIGAALLWLLVKAPTTGAGMPLISKEAPQEAPSQA